MTVKDSTSNKQSIDCLSITHWHGESYTLVHSRLSDKFFYAAAALLIVHPADWPAVLGRSLKMRPLQLGWLTRETTIFWYAAAFVVVVLSQTSGPNKHLQSTRQAERWPWWRTSETGAFNFVTLCRNLILVDLNFTQNDLISPSHYYHWALPSVRRCSVLRCAMRSIHLLSWKSDKISFKCKWIFCSFFQFSVALFNGTSRQKKEWAA